jgi:hypothetical protein
MKEFIETVNLDEAKEGRKELMWRDPDRFPDLVEAAHVSDASELTQISADNYLASAHCRSRVERRA